MIEVVKNKIDVLAYSIECRELLRRAVDECDNLIELKEVIKETSVTFELLTNRLQSLILCEEKNSYSIQSQRYCKYDSNSKIILSGYDNLPDNIKEDVINTVDYSLKLYNIMTKIKEGHENKVKYTMDDFEYGIPIDDARYVLPMVFTCNTVMTVTGDKIIDLLITMYTYHDLFTDLIEGIKQDDTIPELGKLISKFDIELYTNSIYKLSALKKKSNSIMCGLSNENRNVLSTKLEINGVAALTCTNDIYPHEHLAKTNLCKVADNVTRKLSHTSVSEHGEIDIYFTLSIAAYNQLVRHRHQSVYREHLENIIYNIIDKRYENCIIIPRSIMESSICDITSDFKVLTNSLYKLIKDIIIIPDTDYNYKFIAAQLIQMGLPLKLRMRTNLSNELYKAQKRTCMKAQWEIRMLTHSILLELSNIYDNSEILKLGMPSCMTTGCKEGKFTCGNNNEVKALFENI